MSSCMLFLILYYTSCMRVSTHGESNNNRDGTIVTYTVCNKSYIREQNCIYPKGRKIALGI